MMENYFATLFEDFRHEWSVIILLSLTDEGILKHAGISDHELKIY